MNIHCSTSFSTLHPHRASFLNQSVMMKDVIGSPGEEVDKCVTLMLLMLRREMKMASQAVISLVSPGTTYIPLIQ